MKNALSELLPFIINNYDSGVIVLDNNFKVVILNDWVKKHSNLNKVDVLNQNILSLFPNIKDKRIHTVIIEAITLNRASILSQAIHKSPLPLYQDSIINGEKRLMQQHIIVKPIKIENHFYCLLQIIDMSAAVTKVQLLSSITTNAQIAKEHAESLSNIKSEFISTISHELRTPLTSISGSIGLIIGGVSGDLNPQTLEMLNIAHRNSDRLLSLINELLDIQKIESGMVQFNFKDKNLNSLITNCIDMNSSYAEKYNAKYEFTPTEKKSDVYIDEQRITQVVLNLLSNAAKFSDKNSTIIVKVEHLNTIIRIIITDNGPGISDEFKNKIFTKFAQADTDDNRTHSSSGLGLCISKSIIEHHNGKIAYKNNKKGASFYFDLPLDKVDHPFTKIKH